MCIHIIGGGVIGLFSAWYLREAGCEVTVIDQTDLSGGCSYGNAGMIVASDFIPLAAPGVIAKGLRWMFNNRSPFYIKPRLDWSLVQWLWRFYRSCSAESVRQVMPFLRDFNQWSQELYSALIAQEGLDLGYEEKGLLYLSRTAKARQTQTETVEQARSLGIEARLLTAAEAQALNPGVRLDVLGGVYYPGDSHLYPDRLMSELLAALRQKGVSFLPGRAVTDFRTENGTIRHLILDGGEALPVEQAVLAGGSWSADLLRRLKLKILLQDGKGYSLTLHDPVRRPGVPILLSEAKVALTPMGEGLRVGGTLEISGRDPRINRSRMEGILEAVPAYFPELQIPFPEPGEIWYGYRPCTPDGLPYLGRYPGIANLIVATGHAMLGISQGPATGKLVAELLTGQALSMDISMLAPDRFQGKFQ